MDNILESVKHVLMVDQSSEDFDIDIKMHTNSALAVLNQLGVGPAEGFEVDSGEELWSTFLVADPKRLSLARSYVFLYVRLLFDPPQSGYLTTSMEKQKTEMEWRLNVVREEELWTDPNPSLTSSHTST